MFVTTHVLVGGALGVATGDPLAGFLLGFVSHFILDAIPHFDKIRDGSWSREQIVLTSIDFSICILLLFFLQPPITILSPFWWGAFGAFLPDLLDNVPFWHKFWAKSSFGKGFHNFHDKIHQEQPNPVFGIMTQLVFIIPALLFLT